jgi:hypothetical protein
METGDFPMRKNSGLGFERTLANGSMAGLSSTQPLTGLKDHARLARCAWSQVAEFGQ